MHSFQMAVEPTSEYAPAPTVSPDPHAAIRGEFVDLDGERYYAIRNVDWMAPFLVSVISSDDHWMFVSSTGGLTAGRVSPETALFPYITVDNIHDSTWNTGSMTRLRLRVDDGWKNWDPFTIAQDGDYSLHRNLYKSLLGDKLSFEEINRDLGLAFRYTWQTSSRYGFVRSCELENLGSQPAELELLDGIQNVLPAGTPRYTQTNSSNLVDAYKWTEHDAETGLALFSLYSGISDRPEPCESLKANVAYCIGLDAPKTLLSTEQVERFRAGLGLDGESLKRGVRGAFLVTQSISLGPGESLRWQIVANTEQTQGEVVELQRELADRRTLRGAISRSVREGTDRLARIMASADGFQVTGEENVSAHHYSNVLFNVLRGGIFFHQYNISGHDLKHTIRTFNRPVYEKNRAELDQLADLLSIEDVAELLRRSSDVQLQRLVYEYLPITFGRRHGDPSRPWNQFAIRLRDADGFPLLSYQGNWRDIFQNWEALALSFPAFVENMIAKFVNASTADGYNPYRITKEGIDWEVEDPDDPWSYIGYWGDHQIIYLQKLLEISRNFNPQRIGELLDLPIFSYANVPYRIRPFDALLKDPKTTVDYDETVARQIEARIETLGADGKLLLTDGNNAYQVNLLEKLLVPLLAKLANLVVDGGIWMNTQRPEWNDANNALVGQGLSMVTLCYLRRYVRFLDNQLEEAGDTTTLSVEVSTWLDETLTALDRVAPLLGSGPIGDVERLRCLTELGEAAGRYRAAVYSNGGFTGKTRHAVSDIRSLNRAALKAIDHSISTNRRDDGLFHAYNLLVHEREGIRVGRLYPMLEGQVAVLSTGSLEAEEAAGLLDALFASSIYRADQHSFMLYPDRELPGFLEKNRIDATVLDAVPLLSRLVTEGDQQIVLRDADGNYRFNAKLINKSALDDNLDSLIPEYGDETVNAARGPILEVYEQVFNHQAFTGRSGTMFGFEGLGCVYWHMVSKLLLATQESYFRALDSAADEKTVLQLGALYYQVRQGIGFNKTPQEFGAFPLDPYSHTPKHAGARQPGMTGQVKEELITRLGELGVRVKDGQVHFAPTLLRTREFVQRPHVFRYVDVAGNWQELSLPAQSLVFTWCQVPIVYKLASDNAPGILITLEDDSRVDLESLELPGEYSGEIFRRTGRVRRLDVHVPPTRLFNEPSV